MVSARHNSRLPCAKALVPPVSPAKAAGYGVVSFTDALAEKGVGLQKDPDQILSVAPIEWLPSRIPNLLE